MTAPDAEALLARLRRLEDVEAARGLLASYARACDAQDLEAVVSLFGPDAQVAVPGASWQGREGVRQFYSEAWAADPSRKSHFVANVRAVSHQVDSVTVDSYFMYTAAGDRSSVLGWGEYRDEIDTSGPQPLFTRKEMSVTRAADVREGWALVPGTEVSE